jgi:hypothetical protein
MVAWFSVAEKDGSWDCICGPMPKSSVEKSILRSKCAQMAKDEKGETEAMAKTNIPGQFYYCVDYKGKLHENTPEISIGSVPPKYHLAAGLIQRKFREHLLKKEGLLIPILGTVQGETGWYLFEAFAAWFSVTAPKDVNSDAVWTCDCGPVPFFKLLKSICNSKVTQMEKDKQGASASLAKTKLPVIDGQVRFCVDHLGLLHSLSSEVMFDEATEKHHCAAVLIQKTLRKHVLKQCGPLLTSDQKKEEEKIAWFNTKEEIFDEIIGEGDNPVNQPADQETSMIPCFGTKG